MIRSFLLTLLLVPQKPTHGFIVDRISFRRAQTRARALIATEQTQWEEIAIDASNPPSTTLSVGQKIKQGDTVILLSDILSPQECSFLVDSCSRIANQTTPTELEKQGLVRLPTIAASERAAKTKTPCAEPLPKDVDELLDQILIRIAQQIDADLPSIADVLFDGKNLSSQLNQLRFSSREPAINVYSAGGEFLAHKDAQALTVLIPVSCPTQFVGGGTAFWSQDARGHRVEEPSITLKPKSGTAMLFGGCVTHAGVPVESGCRVVFVASFSLPGQKMEAEQRDIYGDLIS